MSFVDLFAIPQQIGANDIDQWPFLYTLPRIFTGLHTAYLFVILASFLTCVLAHVYIVPALYKNSAIYKKFNARDKKEWGTRFVSSVHSLIVWLICFYALLTDDYMWEEPVWYKNKFVFVATSISSGYFFADTIQITYYNIPPLVPILIHHMLAGFGFLGGIGITGRFCCFGALLLMTEGTTPFSNLLWWYEQGKLTNTFKYRLTFHIYTITWIICRLLIWFVIYYQVYQHWDQFKLANVYMRAMIYANFTFLTLLNYSWFFLLGPFKQFYLSEKKSSKKKSK